MGANGVQVFKILTFGWFWNCTSFENLTKAESLFSTQGVISCLRDTEANSAYIFLKVHPHMQTAVNTNNREIIKIILMVSKYL